jgi:hypothetical protein
MSPRRVNGLLVSICRPLACCGEFAYGLVSLCKVRLSRTRIDGLTTGDVPLRRRPPCDNYGVHNNPRCSFTDQKQDTTYEVKPATQVGVTKAELRRKLATFVNNCRWLICCVWTYVYPYCISLDCMVSFLLRPKEDLRHKSIELEVVPVSSEVEFRCNPT